MKESVLSRVMRMSVGALLLLEALLFLPFALYLTLMGGSLSLWSLVRGTSNRDGEMVLEALQAVALLGGAPLVLTTGVGAGALLLLQRRARYAIVGTLTLALAGQVGVYLFWSQDLHPLQFVLGAVHLGAIAAAVAFVP